MSEAPVQGPPQPDAEGNYNSPPLNALRVVWADYQAGIAAPEDVFTVLQAVEDLTQLQIRSMRAQVESGQSDPENASFKLILEGFEQHLAALELMGLEFDEPGQSHFEEGLAVVQAATNQLMRGHSLLLEHIEAASRVACIFCAQENPRGSERCSQCSRNLPVAPEERVESSFSAVNQEGLAGGAQGQVTENYALLAQAVEAWRRSELESEGLLAQIETVEQRLLEHQEANQALKDDLDRLEENRRGSYLSALEATEDSLQASLQAVSKMKLAFEKEDDSYLESGLHEMRAASGQMLASMQAMQTALS